MLLTSLLAMVAVQTGTRAMATADFLDSIGVNSAISLRGESLEKSIACAKYLGVRWFRSGTEGGPALADLLELHRQTGAKFSWGLGSGGTDLTKLIETGKQLAAAGALLAFEGNNEPNNWGVTYQGATGGRDKSWGPVAALQRDLYRSVKADPLLRTFPVWGVSECGAETDNVGLQYLVVPKGANAIVPEGTHYADAVNIHNYIYHPNSPKVEDNKTWNAADPTKACRVDGLFGEVGVTWAKHFPGYSETELLTLPRVTTETGCTIEGEVTEEVHAANLLTMYLDQFKRGWSHTAVYLLRDRVDEAGNQQFGFYKPDYTPRKAAEYLHHLTRVLADSGRCRHLGRLDYTIKDQSATVHDLLLQNRDGRFQLIVWSEKVGGGEMAYLSFPTPVNRVHVTYPLLGDDGMDISIPAHQIMVPLDKPVVIAIG